MKTAYGLFGKRTAGRLLVFALLTAALFACGCAEEDRLIINEAVSSNKISFVDDALGTPDWIELKNGGTKEMNLRGYILSDRADTFETGCMLPDITVPAGGYAVIPAGSDALCDAFRLPFGLSRMGETLYLLTPSGKLIDKLVLPGLKEDVSYARDAEGNFGYCLTPTPGAANTTAIYAEMPEAESNATVPSDIKVTISEVVTSDLVTGIFGGADWVELYNPTDSDISLDGCFITDDDTKPRKQRLDGVTVPAGGYALLPCSKESNAPEGSLSLALSSTGETVSLFDPLGNRIDSVAVPAMTKGSSYARGEDGLFSVCVKPTPGEANSTVGLTVTAMDETAPVRLSEAVFTGSMGALDPYGDRCEFVELRNTSGAPVLLDGYYLSDDRGDLTKWAFPAGTVIGAGEYRVIYLAGANCGKTSTETALYAPFAVSGDEEGVFLFDGNGFTYDVILNADAEAKNVSLGAGDGDTAARYLYATPGAVNAEVYRGADGRVTALKRSVYISEVSAGGKNGEWVELRNGGSEATDLTGWSLGDGNADHAAFHFGGTLDAGACLVLSPDGFALSKAGETLILSDGNGFIRDIFATGDLTDGLTSGRTETGTDNRVFFMQATKGTANTADTRVGRAGEPLFSDTALYHTEPFTLTLAANVTNAEIRYTLDGTEPGERSILYTGPLTVDRNTNLRVKVYAEGCVAGRTVSRAYLFEDAHTLPVVTLSCDPQPFASYTRLKETGNYAETPVTVAYYEADGSFAVSFNAGLKPRGNTSIKYPQKSLSLHLRSQYGETKVSYPFWGESGKDYAFLILRNGSQDYAKARLRDSFALRASRGMRLDSAQTRPVIVYVNGSYYGIMDLNEGMNQDYLVTEYGVDKETVNHVSTNTTVRYGDSKDFLAARKYARTHDFTDDKALDGLSSLVDIGYVTDYLIAQTFFCNYDIHNQSYWGTSDGTIRYRPVFYDIDRCLCEGTSNKNLFDWYFDKKGVKYDSTHTVNMDIFAALRDNPSWCRSFLERYAELLSGDLSVETLTALLDSMEAELEPEMARHIKLYRAPASMAEWHGEIAAMKKEIAKRHAAIQEQLKKEFGIGDAEWNALMQKYA